MPARTPSPKRPTSYLELPPGWERVETRTAGPFVTAERLRRPDGTTVSWASWTHRKQDAVPSSHVWWRPRRMGWWIGLLFALGSTCFLVAACAAQVQSPPGAWIDPTFFVGSLLFTTAAYLQYAEAVNVERRPLRRGRRQRLRPASWEPRRIDWLAAAVQLAGTVLFNVSTFAAMQDGFTILQDQRRVWAPDALGSACFLLASGLAFAEVCQRWACVRARSRPWWIVALNLAGSVAFGVAAAASAIEPDSGEPVNEAIANVGTAIGALGFLVAALLLVRQTARAPRPAGD